jgi:NAD(P)-dependent dehydrogenase (short-subunit alcohol dehydrogenase family)
MNYLHHVPLKVAQRVSRAWMQRTLPMAQTAYHALARMSLTIPEQHARLVSLDMALLRMCCGQDALPVQARNIRSVAPAMIVMSGGSIINLGSNSWWETVGGFPAYATAKAAVHGLTRTMARDLGQHRIRINTVVPGWIMTDRQKELWATPEGLEAHRKSQCLPDLIDPVYVARMVLFLASDDAAMCTASNFMIEAGSI